MQVFSVSSVLADAAFLSCLTGDDGCLRACCASCLAISTFMASSLAMAIFASCLARLVCADRFVSLMGFVSVRCGTGLERSFKVFGS